jgi:hypothetical protein
MADDLKRITEERQRWQQRVEQADAGQFQTLSGVPLDSLYTPADVAGPVSLHPRGS